MSAKRLNVVNVGLLWIFTVYLPICRRAVKYYLFVIYIISIYVHMCTHTHTLCAGYYSKCFPNINALKANMCT